MSGQHEGRCNVNKLYETLAGILERRENNEVKITFIITPKEKAS